jgi:hypothetical protein
MATPSPVHASEALDELVNQFSDPLSFFRELIQNSLDAGSAEVEVRIDYEPGEGADGAMIIHVDDWGDGMDKEIIDKRLTRLFSSAKDGDMTKIGKFGIGFVSVFAIDPDAVVVDTSREGEHWRVIFDEKRAFTCLRRDTPVDGTKVSIYKTATREEYAEFVVAAERTVRYWCKHTRGEVRFQGELINEEFDLEDPCKVVHDDGFSKIVVSHPWDGETFFGFYNQGLTLVEGDTGRFEGLAYKASSPHLEHTLTRDNVIRDEAFHKVMGDVEQLATGQLRRRVFESLEALEYDPAVEDPRREYWLRALLWHLKTGRALPSEDMRRPVLPLCGGARASIHETERGLRNALLRDRLLWSPVENPVTAHLREQGELVFHVRDDSYGLQVLHLLAMRGLSPEQRADADRVRRVNQVWCKPGLPEGELPAEVNTLGRALETMLREHGAKLSTVAFGHLAYPGSRIKGRVAITQSELGELTEIAESGRLGRSLWASRRALVVNLDHAAVADLVGLAAEEPELAAYKLIKLFFLGRELDVELAAELADIAWQQRWQR